MPPKGKRVHFVGIGGASLNGLAQVLAARGYRVSGSDLVASPVTERLASQGIKIIIGQRAANITADIDEVVISSAVVAGPGAVEVAAARKRDIPVHKRTIWWSRLMGAAKTAVAVAGTHGKTSTTAMLGFILQEAGFDPTVLVGGQVPDFNGTVRVGGPDCVVVEADEYDHAFYACRPTHAIITNIDYDHPDTYPTPVAYRQAFGRFARRLRPRRGRLVVYGDQPATRQLFGNWRAIRVKWYGQKRLWQGLRLRLPGEHLKLNATAAALVAHDLGVPRATINQALASWRGVERRFELIGSYRGLPVYDDYAHHPAEIAATLAAARTLTTKPLAVLFQPHQRIRTRHFLDDFAAALAPAERVGILPLFAVAGREEDIKISSDDIVRKSMKFSLVADDQLKSWLDEVDPAHFGLILVLGAGDISAKVRLVIDHHGDPRS